jgi:rod shape-determining protein MreB
MQQILLLLKIIINFVNSLIVYYELKSFIFQKSKQEMAFFRLFSNDLAIDLGTANTLIWMPGKGIILDEPSVVAFDRSSKHIIAIGKDAQTMIGKTHKEIKVIRPLRDGVIADFEIAEGMLRAFIHKVTKNWQPPRRVVIGVPSGISEVEKRAVRDSAEHAGAREVHLIAEPMAAAIGIGMDVHQSLGNMIVDIGGGTSEIAVISLAGIVADLSLRIAGNVLNNNIVQYFRRTHNLLIGERTSEIIKHQAGSAAPMEEELDIEVRGRDLVTGIPKMIVVSSVDIRNALAEPITEIVNGILRLLEQTPPELAADILDRGIFLSGGGALLKELDKRISKDTGMAVYIAEEPLQAVARGAGKVLENLSYYSPVLIKNTRY